MKSLIVSLIMITSMVKVNGQECVPARSQLVAGCSGSMLEVVDWGGHGKPLIFLAGLGNTAHVFSDFAPELSSAYHVLGITRRGFGQSAGVAGAYSLDLLVKDIVAVADSLHLNRFTLVGHSFAGDEMTLLAGRYPDRVERLVYLDAAYDRTLLRTVLEKMPAIPLPSNEDVSTAVFFAKYLERIQGVAIPLEEVESCYVLGGSLTSFKLKGDPMAQYHIGRGLVSPSYANVRCRVLAIYAVPCDTRQLLPFYDTLVDADRVRADSAFAIYRQYADSERRRLTQEVSSAAVHLIDCSSHYLFITHKEEVKRLMLDFLREP